MAGYCPICGRSMKFAVLERHAADCNGIVTRSGRGNVEHSASADNSSRVSRERNRTPSPRNERKRTRSPSEEPASASEKTRSQGGKKGNAELAVIKKVTVNLERLNNAQMKLQLKLQETEMKMEMEKMKEEKARYKEETRRKEKELRQQQLRNQEEHQAKEEEIEIIKIIKKEKIETAMDRGFNCPTCREIFIRPVILNCGHTYCWLCLAQWKNSNGRTRGDLGTCPECREQVRSETRVIAIENKSVSDSLDYDYDYLQ